MLAPCMIRGVASPRTFRFLSFVPLSCAINGTKDTVLYHLYHSLCYMWLLMAILRVHVIVACRTFKIFVITWMLTWSISCQYFRGKDTLYRNALIRLPKKYNRSRSCYRWSQDCVKYLQQSLKYIVRINKSKTSSLCLRQLKSYLGWKTQTIIAKAA